MPTRLKRRAIWRPLLVSVALIGFQAYLGYYAVNGQFGWLSQKQMHLDIEQLKGNSFALQAEIDDYKHRKSLFDSARLDPDLLTERARSLLDMGSPTALLVMLDPKTGKPITSSFAPLTQPELTTNMAVHYD